MAKALPYFKFYCSEWNDGDITLEDMKTQGVFINICSYYWSQECEVFEEKLQKRFKKYSKQIENLKKEKIIFSENEKVVIRFLDKQWNERESIKLRNQQNGKAGGRPKKTQSVISGKPKENPSETNIEKRREEKRRKDKIIIKLPSFVDVDLFNDFLDLRKKLKAPNTQRAVNSLIKQLTDNESQANSMLSRSYDNGWRGLFPQKGGADSNKTVNHGIDLSKSFLTEEEMKELLNED